MHLRQDLVSKVFGRNVLSRQRGRRGVRVAASVPCAESLESRAMLSGVSAALQAFSQLLDQQPALQGVLTNGVGDLIRNSVPARYQSQLDSLFSSLGQADSLAALPSVVTESISTLIDAAVPSGYQSAVHNAVDALFGQIHDTFVATIPEPVLSVLDTLSGFSAAAPMEAGIAPQVSSQTEAPAEVPAGLDPLTEVIDSVVSLIPESYRANVQGLVDDSVGTLTDSSDSLPELHDSITETISNVTDRLPSQYRVPVTQVVGLLPHGLLDEVFSFIGHRRDWMSFFA